MSAAATLTREGGVRAVGAARRSFDARPLWAARERGAEGWGEEARLSKRLAEDLAGVAGDALAAAGLGGPLAAGCAVGTPCGFGHVAEAIDRQLVEKGPAWLEPESFVYYPAHVVTGTACMRFGLAGDATTFVGPSAGRQALRHATRSLLLGRQTVHLAGSYQVVSPTAAKRHAGLGIDADPATAEASFVVLEMESR